MIIAHITDPHVRPVGKPAYGVVDTNAMLAAAVTALDTLRPRPDVVLITGDLTNDGLAEEYAVLREILAPLPIPVYAVPGNHDRRDNLRVAFRDQPYLPQAGHFLHYLVEGWPVRLIGLDTVTPGEIGGYLCPVRLAWLEERLAEAPGRPTVIFMHHPPFEVGVAAMDRINCYGGAEMGTIVARYPNVERVLCGHHHRPVQVRWCGTVGSVAPSTAHQAVIDLDGGPLRFRLEPPAFQLHLWRSEISLISHTLVIGDFGRAREYRDEPDRPEQGSPSTRAGTAA